MSNLAALLKNRGKRLSGLAKDLSVNKGTVSRWSKNGVPVDRLSEVEKATGIPACDLRPDVARVMFGKTRESAQ